MPHRRHGRAELRCEHCETDHFAWRSCNHRLCPRCGAADTAQWVASKLEGRIPVDHFMVTFTLPEQLRLLCRYDSKTFYRLFFACAAQAIKDVLKQPRHLGGQCGFFGMLQTWTQELRLHPHIHFVVPAVAIGKDGKIKRPRDLKWLAKGDIFASRLKTLLLKKLKKEEMLPASDISNLWKIDWYRGACLRHLNERSENNTATWRAVILRSAALRCRRYAPRYGSGENAVKYLGAYVFNGPISDSRRLACDGRTVTISVKDRKSGESHPVEISRKSVA